MCASGGSHQAWCPPQPWAQTGPECAPAIPRGGHGRVEALPCQRGITDYQREDHTGQSQACRRSSTSPMSAAHWCRICSLPCTRPAVTAVQMTSHRSAHPVHSQPWLQWGEAPQVHPVVGHSEQENVVLAPQRCEYLVDRHVHSLHRAGGELTLKDATAQSGIVCLHACNAGVSSMLCVCQASGCTCLRIQEPLTVSYRPSSPASTL